MTKTGVASFLAAGLIATAIPLSQTQAAPPSGIRFRTAHALRGSLGSASTDARSTAREALGRYASTLGVDAGTFRFESVQRSLIGRHVRGRQFRDGVPVQGSTVLVSIIGGKVAQIDAYAQDLPGRPTADPISAAAAKSVAKVALGVTRALKIDAERLLVPNAGTLVDTWRVSVLSAAPALATAVDIDAATGEVLHSLDTNDYIKGSAMVFDPNPIVSTRDNTLRQPVEQGQPVDADLDSPELTAARIKRPLRELDPTAMAAGHLEGPWVKVFADGMESLDGNYDFTRSDPRFEATMAYAHLDRVQRYFQRLGFKGETGANAEQQDVVAEPIQGFDNSFYQPGNDIMVLGSGGVDDGEDAEVVVHEYGHAVQDDQVPGWGNTHEGGSMGEGFGDFLAANYYARKISKGFQNECLMEWDSTSYSSENPTCLRRLDRDKKYPKDKDDDVHLEGELWSGFLWTLRHKLGDTSIKRSDRATRLVLTSHFLLTPEAEFGDAVAALRKAAKGLGHPGWKRKINRAANHWGLPLNPK
jgi:Zn-dependent metalloprotease